MKQHRHKRIFGGLLAAGLLISPAFLAGAGASVRAAEASEPRQGGSITIAEGGDTPTLDPFEPAHSFYGLETIGATYSKLVKFATGEGIPQGTNELRPDLAESWEMSDDGLHYTFNLRQDVTWQNVAPLDGRPFTAADVVASYEAYMGSRWAYLLGPLESVEATDDHTVVFTLGEPFAPFLSNQANGGMWILPKEGLDGEFPLATQAIGTGPYILQSWTQGGETKLVRNPDYFVEGRPYLDEISIVRVPSSGTRISAFCTGDLDLIRGRDFTNADLDRIRGCVPGANVIEIGSLGILSLYLNWDKPPLDDVRVRRAIQLAIDAEGMKENIRAGRGGTLSGPVSAHVEGWSLPPERVLELNPYDPDQARALLAEAGYADGLTLELSATSTLGEVFVQEAQWIQQDLAEVGIDVEIVVEELGAQIERYNSGNYEMHLTSGQVSTDPDPQLFPYFHSDGPQNYANVSDAELDDMLERQRVMLDVDERIALVHELQEYYIVDLAVDVRMYSWFNHDTSQPYVHGYYRHAAFTSDYFQDIWIDQ